jgi:hypothetical protein
MSTPRIYADFNNADAHGRLRLNCIGTVQDLARQQVQLREGLNLALYDADADDQGMPDDLQVDGVAHYSAEEQCWVASIDWAAIRHVSAELRGEQTNGAPEPRPTPDKEQA